MSKKEEKEKYFVWSVFPYEGFDCMECGSWEEAMEFIKDCAGRKHEKAMREFKSFGRCIINNGEYFVTSGFLKKPLEKR